MTQTLEDIIIENKNFIYKIASKYSKYYNIEDLFQVGVIGFIKAYKNYKSTTCKFTTYAYKYVLGEMIEYIRNDRNIKVSSDTFKIYNSYIKTCDFLTNKYGKVPTLEYISKFMNIDVSYLLNVIKTCEFSLSLENELNDDFTLESTLGKDTTYINDYLIDLKSEINNLPMLEKEIIKLRYFKDYTQTETAKLLGLSQVEVSRNESKILKKIKTNIGV